mmetsp:Transcript_21991/g.41966  ORF Transcript_21991/g.41966 Transcript_21991/m.41966 type:complete len:244 (+) Transcript_21991:1911-2642(+)
MRLWGSDASCAPVSFASWRGARDCTCKEDMEANLEASMRSTSSGTVIITFFTSLKNALASGLQPASCSSDSAASCSASSLCTVSGPMRAAVCAADMHRICSGRIARACSGEMCAKKEAGRLAICSGLNAASCSGSRASSRCGGTPASLSTVHQQMEMPAVFSSRITASAALVASLILRVCSGPSAASCFGLRHASCSGLSIASCSGDKSASRSAGTTRSLGLSRLERSSLFRNLPHSMGIRRI